MSTRTTLKAAAAGLAGGAALAALGYAAYAGAKYTQYGHAGRPRNKDEEDPLLDGFMPLYDIVERHHIVVEAPAETTIAAARETDLDSPVIRAIFRMRELAMGVQPAPVMEGAAPSHGMLQAALAIGWGVLCDQPGREVVLGAVTRPWEATPVFRDLLPRDFAAFAEPDYVKIAFTLRADPVSDTQSIFRTETRAIATDVDARAKFRRYWALVSPGVALIRLFMLQPVKCEAERRAEAARTAAAPQPAPAAPQPA